MSHDGIEKAKLEDLPRILQIYASARKFMKQSGNPKQWGDSFPPEDLLAKDIEKEQLYVVKDDTGIHGVFAFIIGKEPTYEKIEQGAGFLIQSMEHCIVLQEMERFMVFLIRS